MKRLSSLLAVASMLGGMAALSTGATAAGTSSRAQAAATLPTINIALSGSRGVSVSGSTVSGAVQILATHTGKGMGFYGIVRLNPGVTIQQAAGAVQSHHGDINALDPYGSLLVSAAAPGAVQTLLTPGSYVGLNITGNGQPGFAPFTVTQASSPAALPAARTTETSIEFGFRGPTVLHNGTMVRAHNGGYLVHMDTLVGVRNAATGRTVIALMNAGKGRQAQRLTNGRFLDLIGPASPGAMQQEILHATPGYYVQACFMNTQDGRDHAQLGMARVIRIVK
ncbi:MAG TPA: hypothetical protein VF781_10120 [Solirubrobacteraceae bacterium]